MSCTAANLTTYLAAVQLFANGNERTEHDKSSQNDEYRTDDKMGNIDDPLPDEIAQSLDKGEPTGGPVYKPASIANKCWNHNLTGEKLKEKIEKYHRPANCDKIITPRMNPEI